MKNANNNTQSNSGDECCARKRNTGPLLVLGMIVVVGTIIAILKQ